MKILGLIVEYNPFHNGHLYHIKESIRQTNADKVVVVMSGDFVQRGAPAIMEKHLRTEMALNSGVAVVFELPVRYATGSAEYFAHGAVSLLDQLGCIDVLSFGSECGNIEDLNLISDILLDEPLAFSTLLQEYQKAGNSFPLSRQLALKDYLTSQNYPTRICNLLEEPNNILGVEYIKALKKLKSNIEPITIQRQVSHYHDLNLVPEYSSASAIRNTITSISSLDKEHNTIPEQIIDQIPVTCYHIMEQKANHCFPIETNALSLLFHNRLLIETKESLQEYVDITPELGNRIFNMRNQFVNFQQFCELIKTKNMTLTRIQRGCLHILLQIKTQKEEIKVPYARVLGFRKSDQEILRVLDNHTSIPLITKISATTQLDNQGLQLLAEDIYASNVYQTLVTQQFQTPYINEHQKALVLI